MRYYIGAALFLLAAGFRIQYIFIFRRMMDEVNASLPPGDQIPEIGLSLLHGKVIKLHRHFFPESKLSKKLYTIWWLQAAAFTSSVAFVVQFK